MGLQITASQIKAIAGSAARADLVAAIVRGWPTAVEKANITTKLRAAHFLAQIMTETGGLRILEESGAYSASRIVEIFGPGHHSAKVGSAEAKRIASLPVAQRGPVLFNRVYGVGNPKKMREFNNIGPNDGWLYRGGGMMQATGKSNYAAMEKKTGLPLVAHPELLHQPDSAFMAAYLEWAQDGRCNAAADRDDVVAVRKIINGGANGIAECRAYLAKAKKALTGYGATAPLAAFAEPDAGDDTEDDATADNDTSDDTDVPAADDRPEVITDPDVVQRVQARLKKLGYYEIGKADGDLTPKGRTEGAILAFRNENDLPLRPTIDSEFLAALAKAQPRAISDARAAATTDDLRAEGVETIGLTDRFKKWAGRIFGLGLTGSAGTGIFATWIGKLSDATSISGEMIAVIILALLALLGIACVGLIVWFIADKIERKRVDDYRKAKNT